MLNRGRQIKNWIKILIPSDGKRQYLPRMPNEHSNPSVKNIWFIFRYSFQSRPKPDHVLEETREDKKKY